MKEESIEGVSVNSVEAKQEIADECWWRDVHVELLFCWMVSCRVGFLVVRCICIDRGWFLRHDFISFNSVVVNPSAMKEVVWNHATGTCISLHFLFLTQVDGQGAADMWKAYWDSGNFKILDVIDLRCGVDVVGRPPMCWSIYWVLISRWPPKAV